MCGPAAFAVDQPAGIGTETSRTCLVRPMANPPGARAYLDRATNARSAARETRPEVGEPSRHRSRRSRTSIAMWLKRSPEVSAVVIAGAPHPDVVLSCCWPTGSPTSSRPQARRPADAMAGALRVGPHGAATTASWGFVRMAAPPPGSDNLGMLRGAPSDRAARASSHDDVGRWTGRSTTEAALLVEQSANRRAGARA